MRLTHLATGIVVACQRERSQIQNYAVAMQILKARLAEKLTDDRRSEMERYYGEKGEVGWGNRIRSYVFQPYQMVKDLRNRREHRNIQGVMDLRPRPVHQRLAARGVGSPASATRTSRSTTDPTTGAYPGFRVTRPSGKPDGLGVFCGPQSC